MTQGTEGFALGAGRSRPAHQSKALDCTQCGGSLALEDERARVIVCRYCHAQLELTPTQARAIGVVTGNPPAFELDIGAPFHWGNVRYEVVGRMARYNPDDPEDIWNHDFFLYNPRHPTLWLSSYGRQWSLSRRTRVLPVGNVFEQYPGSTMTTHDGRRWRTVELEISQITYVDGALPWLACVGDQTRHVELHSLDSTGETYEAEHSARGELELSRGHVLTEADVRAAAGGALRPRGGGHAALAPGEDRPQLRAISTIMLGFGLLSLLTAAFFAFAGSELTRGTLPPQGGRVGPLVIAAPNTVLEVDVSQSFRMDGWSFIEGEVQDEEGEHLFGFGDELWAESGYDDGSWHEEKNDYELDLTIPEPGTYYLGFTGTDSAQQSGIPAGGAVQVVVHEKIGSSLPFFVAGIIAFLMGAFLFLVASSKLRKSLAQSGQRLMESSS